MVWYRYRQARRYVREEDLRRREAARRRRRDDEYEMRRIAARKRAEKEAQQYLDLASKNEYNFYYGTGRIRSLLLEIALSPIRSGV